MASPTIIDTRTSMADKPKRKNWIKKDTKHPAPAKAGLPDRAKKLYSKTKG